MRLFYYVLFRLTEFELAIARSTGRNPDNVSQLSGERDRWESAYLTLEINK